MLVCKFKPDPDLALRCGILKGVPIGKVGAEGPRERLKRIAIEEAKTFVGHMKNQGYQAAQAETEMELWGPYREKVNMAKASTLVNIEAGNPFFPQGRWASAAKGAAPAERGPQELTKAKILDSQDYRHGVSFLIRGKFVTAKFGKQEETTGVVLV